MENNKKVTVVGLGQMGIKLAELLIENNYEVTVWNRTPDKMHQLVSKGAIAAQNIEEAIAASALIVTCVFDYAASKDIFSKPGVSGIVSGKTIVQLTTGSPGEAKEMEAWANSNGAQFLAGAIQVAPEQMGQPDTTILISGNETAYNNSKSILDVFGGNFKYLGASAASAPAMDLATLSTIYGTIIGFFHGIRISETAGFDVNLLATIVAEMMPSFTGFLKHEANVVHIGDFSITQSPLAISVTATQRILDAAKEAGISTVFPALAAGLLNEAQQSGYEKEELASVIKVLRNHNRN